MFLMPMSMQQISELSDPSERVPLAEHLHYGDALSLIEDGGFVRYELKYNERSQMNLRMEFKDLSLGALPKVTVQEMGQQKVLSFSCSHCTQAGRKALTCPHQWATYIVLWQALCLQPDDIKQTEIRSLALDLKPDQAPKDEPASIPEYSGVTLDSISLYLDEPPLLKGDPIATHLKENLEKYKFKEVSREEEALSPRLFHLPEIFRKKVAAYSEHYFNEVNKQNRMADILRYNFSNGIQISSKEILRHPLHKKVPGELLPQAKNPASIFARWPLAQQKDNVFVSQSLRELEEIIQALLNQVATWNRQRKMNVYLQSKNSGARAMKVESIEFDPKNELDWRVDFTERPELETAIKLVSFRKQPFYFFESFALEPKSGVILVHPWLVEFSLLQETLSDLSEELYLADREMPSLHLKGEIETKNVLRYLRGRSIPVKISGETRTLEKNRSKTEIRFEESGIFYLQHEARVAGQKNLLRRGWSAKSQIYLQTLSQGLPYLLNIEAKDIATRTRTKRDWDLRLLKHLGILQYVCFETLHYYFEGELSDGGKTVRGDLFKSLHEKIQALLIAGAGSAFVKDVPLSELCSKPVLSCFEDFVQMTLKSLSASEAFYSEMGEVVLEGIIEREFRLIFELLKKMALVTRGECFRRSRTPFLSKISKNEKDFHFPASDTDGRINLQEALESLQPLLMHGYQIFYKDQPLQELEEDEFHVDFVLQTDGDQKFFNWFELNPKFFLRGQEVDPNSLLGLGAGGVIEYEGKIYLVPQKQMPSLRRLENFWMKLQKGKSDSAKKKGSDKIYQLPRSQTLELLALRASGVGIRGDWQWQRLCDFYDSLGKGQRELELPKSVKATLKPYQVTGVQWLQDLYQLKLGALLADDMGLGKTLQTLSFLDDLRSKKELGQVLIVVPSSLIFNWQQEIQKFTPELPVMVFSSKDQDALSKRFGRHQETVVITTYGLLMENEAFLNQYNWKVAIFDEAQNLKNITTKRTSSARSLTAEFKICLTGTPMENHYGEFYSLVDLLVPGSLGKIDEFRRKFVNSEMITREEMDDLKLKMKPLLLRRTKKEILDQLPEKQETKVSIAFEEKQKEIYRDIALSYNQKVQETIATQGEASVQLQMLTALLRLRQACSDPAALPNVRYDKVPPKLEALMDSLAEIVESGESALVFTQFLQTLQHTTELLKAAGIPVFALHGAVPSKQRQKILSDFHSVQGGAVLVMTLKTGGVGLNLTKASYVFHLEPWWNPSVENQATDRAHRLGQSKAVQVFRYIMHESLEEKIEILKERKDRKFQTLFAATESDLDLSLASGSLSKKDFDLLLGIK